MPKTLVIAEKPSVARDIAGALPGSFKKHGFKPVFKETSGGHTWLNWRDYLTEFAPQLFQTTKETKETRVRP